MATRAQLEGNARYLAKLRAFTLRTRPEQDAEIRAAASAAGESVTGYILEAVRARMANGTTVAQDGDRVRISCNASALDGIRQDGESAAQAAARALAAGIKQLRK